RKMRIEIPISDAVRREARLEAIRFSNMYHGGRAEYACRDIRERREIGNIGEFAFVEHYELTKADGKAFDALTKSGKRVEIKVKTAWGIRPDFDIQAVEVGNHDLIVWLLYDEGSGRLYWVGVSYPGVEFRDSMGCYKVKFSEIKEPSIGMLI